MTKKSRSFPVIILLNCLLWASLSIVGNSQQIGPKSSLPANDAAGGAAERIRNEVKVEGPDLLVAENSVRHLEFSSQGLRYLPSTRPGQSPGPDFRFRLKTISSGDAFFVQEENRIKPSAAKEANEVSYSRPMGITELYRSLDSGVEQLFILEHNLHPAGEHLRITGEVMTELVPPQSSLRTSTGITFYTDGRPIVHYSAATVIDAMGRELRAELELDGDQLSIVIDSAWLRRAAYPVTVDPFIGPLVPVVAEGPQRGSPAMAVDARHSRYLVVWAQPIGADFEIMGQFIDVDGKPSACRAASFNISVNPALGDFSPVVTFDQTSERFLVVWEERGLPVTPSTDFDYNLRGRFVGGPSGCAAMSPSGAPIAISSAAGLIERAPSVAAGAVAGAPNGFLVVYLRAISSAREANVYGQMLNPDGSVCGQPVLIGGPSGLDARFYPTVVFGEPTVTEYYSVLYRASDNVLRLARLAPTCGSAVQPPQLIVDPVVFDGPPGQEAAATTIPPTLAYSPMGHRWMINWIDYSSKIGALLRWYELPRFDVNEGYTFATLLGGLRYVKGLSVTSSSDSRDFVVGLSVGTSRSSGYQVLLFQLHYSANYFITTFRRDSLPGMNDWYPVIRSGPELDDYFVVWSRDLPNGNSDIVGQRYTP